MEMKMNKFLNLDWKYRAVKGIFVIGVFFLLLNPFDYYREKELEKEINSIIISVSRIEKINTLSFQTPKETENADVIELLRKNQFEISGNAVLHIK